MFNSLTAQATLNKAAGQKFINSTHSVSPIPGAGVCFNYNFPINRDQVLAPYAPGGGGCQRFTEPVLSPLLYNSNFLVYERNI